MDTKLLLFFVTFVTMISAKTCKLGPMGLLCLQQYKNVNWEGFMAAGSNLKSPSTLLKWKDSERKQWINRMTQLCAPFNNVLKCTAKNGGERWWHCLDDIALKQLLEQIAPQAGSAFDSIPKNPRQLRDGFDAMTDICSPEFLSEFDIHHPCMRSSYEDKGIESVNFRSQLGETDKLLSSTPCITYGCSGAYALTNLMVYWMKQRCGPGTANKVHVLMSSSMRLQMMADQTFCELNQYPRDYSVYESRPTLSLVSMLNRSGCRVKPTNQVTTPVYEPRTRPPPMRKPSPPPLPPSRRPPQRPQRPPPPPKVTNELDLGKPSYSRSYIVSTWKEYDIEFLDIFNGASSYSPSISVICSFFLLLFKFIG